MRIVVDASVALKWMFRSRDDEQDVAAAVALLEGVADERVALLQPPHFIAEVSAVLAREAGAAAAPSLRDLLEIDMEMVEGEAVYERGMQLAQRLSHHVFDTLYHAVALETPGAVLVTADERYYRKAHREGGIMLLRDFGLSEPRE